MSDYTKRAAEIGDRYLAALAARQESFLKYLAATRSLTAQAPAFPGAAAAIATTQQLRDAQFDLASRLLEQQKRFVNSLFVRQMSGKAPVAKPPVRKSKATAKKASAKKAPVKAAARTPGKTSSKKRKSSSKKASARKTSTKRT